MIRLPEELDRFARSYERDGATCTAALLWRARREILTLRRVVREERLRSLIDLKLPPENVAVDGQLGNAK